MAVKKKVVKLKSVKLKSCEKTRVISRCTSTLHFDRLNVTLSVTLEMTKET